MSAKPRIRRTLFQVAGATLVLGIGWHVPAVLAFESGSTGADGAFAPTVDTRLPLPEDGVFNFTAVDIPAGVKVTFGKNTTNTPVVILASGDVTIAGQVRVDGSGSPAAGTAGDGNVADDGLPGQGGPGGYGGGLGGGPAGDHLGGDGQGPGAGKRGLPYYSYRTHGGSGSYGTVGTLDSPGVSGERGPVYGSSLLLPLIGGSGGGGAMGGDTFSGSGGAGGGGAILIASSGTVTIAGGVWADGGRGGDSAGNGCGAVGGAGSGGGIRIVATTIAGSGTLSAQPGYRFNASCSPSGYSVAYSLNYIPNGGMGRIRLEAETNRFTPASTPSYAFGPPADLFIAGLPTLRISRVAGVDAPARPTGTADISLPADIVNPVAVEFETTGIPLGNIVKLTVTPQRGAAATALSNALDGDSNRATASAQVSLPQGPSTLLASITYTLVASLSERFQPYAGGEKVRELRLEVGLDGNPRYVLITEVGREIPLTRAQLAAAG